jgi:hypothetical protein
MPTRTLVQDLSSTTYQIISLKNIGSSIPKSMCPIFLKKTTTLLRVLCTQLTALMTSWTHGDSLTSCTTKSELPTSPTILIPPSLTTRHRPPPTRSRKNFLNSIFMNQLPSLRLCGGYARVVRPSRSAAMHGIGSTKEWRMLYKFAVIF